MVGGKLPTTLYLVVPPSDINRTKPLIRLILNQVGRRLTEDLQAKAGRHRMLLMLDEFPALGRLDRSEEHTSELQSLMCISYAVFCLKKKKNALVQLPNT